MGTTVKMRKDNVKATVNHGEKDLKKLLSEMIKEEYILYIKNRLWKGLVLLYNIYSRNRLLIR